MKIRRCILAMGMLLNSQRFVSENSVLENLDVEAT